MPAALQAHQDIVLDTREPSQMEQQRKVLQVRASLHVYQNMYSSDSRYARQLLGLHVQALWAGAGCLLCCHACHPHESAAGERPLQKSGKQGCQ